MGRPVAFFWETNHPCDSARCASEVLLLGTPLLWWSFIPALAGLVPARFLHVAIEVLLHRGEEAHEGAVLGQLAEPLPRNHPQGTNLEAEPGCYQPVD